MIIGACTTGAAGRGAAHQHGERTRKRAAAVINDIPPRLSQQVLDCSIVEQEKNISLAAS
jgi:hypothetical protein